METDQSEAVSAQLFRLLGMFNTPWIDMPMYKYIFLKKGTEKSSPWTKKSWSTGLAFCFIIDSGKLWSSEQVQISVELFFDPSHGF